MKQRFWIESVLCQFQFGGFGRISCPLWFYLLILSLVMVIRGDILWRGAGLLMILAAGLSMVKNTRGAHGMQSPEPDWTRVVETLLLDFGALILVIGGWITKDRFPFAVGIISFIVLSFFLWFYSVQYLGEKKNK